MAIFLKFDAKGGFIFCKIRFIAVRFFKDHHKTGHIQLIILDIIRSDLVSEPFIGFSEKFADKVQTMPLDEKAYNFQIILDRASIEILLNDGKYSMTNIFFPNEKLSKVNISSSEPGELKNIVINRIDRVWKKNK